MASCLLVQRDLHRDFHHRPEAHPQVVGRSGIRICIADPSRERAERRSHYRDRRDRARAKAIYSAAVFRGKRPDSFAHRCRHRHCAHAHLGARRSKDSDISSASQLASGALQHVRISRTDAEYRHGLLVPDVDRLDSCCAPCRGTLVSWLFPKFVRSSVGAMAGRRHVGIRFRAAALSSRSIRHGCWTLLFHDLPQVWNVVAGDRLARPAQSSCISSPAPYVGVRRKAEGRRDLAVPLGPRACAHRRLLPPALPFLAPLPSHRLTASLP